MGVQMALGFVVLFPLEKYQRWSCWIIGSFCPSFCALRRAFQSGCARAGQTHVPAPAPLHTCTLTHAFPHPPTFTAPLAHRPPPIPGRARLGAPPQGIWGTFWGGDSR